MNWHVDDVLHHPLRIFCFAVALLRLHVSELGGSAVGIDAELVQVLNEQKFVRHDDREEPEVPVLHLVPWAVDACLSEGILSIEVLLHTLSQARWVEDAHAVVDEREHGSAGLEPEARNKRLSWLESSKFEFENNLNLPREGYVELFTLLAGKASDRVDDAISALGVDKVEKHEHLGCSLSVHLGREERVVILDGFHLAVQFIIVADDTDAAVHASLNLDRAKAEHRESGALSPVEVKACKGLSHVLENVDAALLKEGQDGCDVVANAEEVGKHDCFGLQSWETPCGIPCRSSDA